MALQGSGAISLAQIAAEFSDTAPHRLGADFYGAADGVPASGAISMSAFYGTSSLGYSASATVDVTPIPEDGTSVSKFVWNTTGLAAGSSVSVVYSGTVGALGGAQEVEISLNDGANWTLQGITGGSSLQLRAGGFYTLWVRAVADNFTDGATETFTATLNASDSNSVATGSAAGSVNITDTSLTPASVATGTDFVRQFDGIYNSKSEDNSIENFVAKSNDYDLQMSLEFNNFIEVARTPTGWEIRYATGSRPNNTSTVGGTASNFYSKYYNPAGSQVDLNIDNGLSATEQFVMQTGTTIPDSVKYVATPLQAGGEPALVNADPSVSHAIGGDASAPNNATYATNPNTWQALTNGQSIGINHSLTGGTYFIDANDGFVFANATSIFALEIWIRKAGFTDTMVARYCLQGFARDQAGDVPF